MLLLHTLWILALCLPQSSMVAAASINQFHSEAAVVQPVQHWNSSSGRDEKPAVLSNGAIWSFTINGLGGDSLNIDFVMANITGDVPCYKCSALSIAFHFVQGVIQFNSRRNGVWDYEQKRTSPVDKWEKFNLDIKLVADGFKITVDGYWHEMYYSRHRYSQISEVTSYGAGAHVEMTYWEKDTVAFPDNYDSKEDQIAQYQTTLIEYQSTLAQYKMTLKKYEDALSKAQIDEQPSLQTTPQATTLAIPAEETDAQKRLWENVMKSSVAALNEHPQTSKATRQKMFEARRQYLLAMLRNGN